MRCSASFGQPDLGIDELRPGINQLKCLIDLAHLHGIAVIFDLVYNHAGGDFGDRSLWFYDRFTNGNKNNSLYFTDQDWAAGQVFAYWNAAVRQFLIDNAMSSFSTNTGSTASAMTKFGLFPITSPTDVPSAATSRARSVHSAFRHPNRRILGLGPRLAGDPSASRARVRFSSG